MSNKVEKFLGVTVLLLVGLLAASVYTKGFETLGLDLPSNKKEISSKEAQERAVDYIVNNFTITRDQLSVSSITKESGLYKLTIVTQGRTVESYVTTDGELFFPQGLSLNPDKVAGAQKTPTSTPQEIPKSDKPDVKLFTMSFCPYGNVAEEAMKPVVETLGDKVEIQPHYVIYSNYQGGGPDYCIDGESLYCSMHGINELRQNVREMCVYKNNRSKYWDFVEAINKHYSDNQKKVTLSQYWDLLETFWKEAARGLGLDVTTIESCLKDNAVAFSKEDKQLNDEFGIRGSPTLLINGVRYSGDRTPEGYKNAICSAFNQPPEECKVKLQGDTGPASGGCGS